MKPTCDFGGDKVYVQYTKSGYNTFVRKWDFTPFEGAEQVSIGQLTVESAAYRTMKDREEYADTIPDLDYRGALKEMPDASDIHDATDWLIKHGAEIKTALAHCAKMKEGK